MQRRSKKGVDTQTPKGIRMRSSGGSTDLGSLKILETVNWNIDGSQYWMPDISMPWYDCGLTTNSVLT